MPDPRFKTIFVDDRERASGLAESLRRLPGLHVATARLAVGDVWVGERLVIERKEVADFVASLLDGRLERQARALAGLDDRRAMMVIEGEFTRKALGGMAADEVRAGILALQLEWGLPVVRSRDVDDTARWIAVLARLDSGEGNPLPLTYLPAQAARPHPAAHRAHPNAQSVTHNPQLAALQQIPGLGSARAKALLDHFGSMHKLIAASERELAEAPGIGPALARELRDAIRNARI